MDNIRVGIVEDDKDWLRGLCAYLSGQSGITVSYTADNADSLRKLLAEETCTADVVLMDIMLDGVPMGITLAEEVSESTGARVIMLTSMEEKELIFRSFQAGAIDYQIKSEFEALPEAIKAAARRESPISSAAADKMREEFRRLKKLEREFEVKKMQDLITPSELELLKLIDKGYSQSEIAGRLVISIRTVKNHVNHILKKLGTKGSKEAAQEAKEKGLF